LWSVDEFQSVVAFIPLVGYPARGSQQGDTHLHHVTELPPVEADCGGDFVHYVHSTLLPAIPGGRRHTGFYMSMAGKIAQIKNPGNGLKWSSVHGVPLTRNSCPKHQPCENRHESSSEGDKTLVAFKFL
jgi:hypothetical protein